MAVVAAGVINAVIFLRDPLTAQPHEPDITALLRVCDVHNVPLATNLATAELIVTELAELVRTGRALKTGPHTAGISHRMWSVR